MDEFENELGEMLTDRVAGLPHEYDATPSLVARARRRRARKLTTLVAAVVLVATGTTGAVAAMASHRGSERLATAPDTSTSSSSPSTAVPSSSSTSTSAPLSAGPAKVQTVACPVTYAIRTDTPLPAPLVEPRIPELDHQSPLDQLVSYAATTDPRFIVLGPKGWSCDATIAADGQNGLTVSDPASIQQNGLVPYAGSVSIVNDYLWHGGVGSAFACSVFDDPTVVQYMTANYPQLLPCPRAGRTVSRISTHEKTATDANGHTIQRITALESTFVDADGSRGVGWMVLPTGNNTDDGKVSVLTCRPVAPLTADECDTIIADFAARIDPRH